MPEQLTSTEAHREGVQSGCPWWDREQLLQALEEEGTIEGVMSRFGASRNTIKRWGRNHGIDLGDYK